MWHSTFASWVEATRAVSVADRRVPSGGLANPLCGMHAPGTLVELGRVNDIVEALRRLAESSEGALGAWRALQMMLSEARSR